MKTLVPHLILEQFARGQHHGHFSAATACVDISGFTPLTEMLFRHQQDGAEILGEALDSIFGPLASAVYQAGGFIPLYAGDAFTAIFPKGPGDNGETLQRTWQTAANIQSYLMPNGRPRRIDTRYGTISISAKIGLGGGDVQWRIVGENRPRAFYFRGAAITISNQAQSRAKPGQIYIDKSLRLEEEFQIESAVPATWVETGETLAPYLPEFVSPDILTLPAHAEFRHVCPVFISVQTPVETPVLERFIINVMEQANHFGGYLSQVEYGDKGLVLLIYFGAPISYENNVLRAARCLHVLPNAEDGHPVWRAGFTYGLVWAGFRGGIERQEYGIMGDVVNSAARISQLAGWGQVWLDEMAAERLTDEFELGLLGEKYLKGKESPKTLYQMLGPLARINIAYQGRLIGRERELESLRQQVGPIFDGRFAGVTFVYGEAGMGKSRLVFELQQELNDAVNWLYCPADEVLRQSLNPFRYLLQNYFFDKDSNLDQEQFILGIEKLLGQLAALPDSNRELVTEAAGTLKRTKSCLAALLNIYWPNSLYEQMEPKLRHQNTLVALTAFFQAQALCGPIVIQLEDYHWFDPDSQQFLEYLSRHIIDLPAALLLTSRYGDDGSMPVFDMPEGMPWTKLEIGNLDRSGVRSLTEQLLEGPIHFELLDFLVEKSDGRPFFAEQLALELMDQAAVRFESGRFVLDREKSGTIPTTLNTLLISRLDKLPLPVKQIVQTAAILGERFQVSLLKSIVAQEVGLNQLISTATEQRIWVLQDELRYIFKHALLRDAAYAMQAQSHRRELHRLAALNMELLYADQLPAYYGEIAYHYEKAFLQGAPGMDQPAVRFLHLAAERSVDKYDNETALDYIGRALALTPESDYEGRFELHLLREQIYSRLAIYEPWRADIQALAELTGWNLADPTIEEEAPSPLPKAYRARIALPISWFGFTTGDFKLAERSAVYGRKIAEEIGDLFRLGKSYARLGGIMWATGQFDKITDNLQKAMAIFRRLNRINDLVGCLNTLGITAVDQGQYMVAWNHYQEALGYEVQTLTMSLTTYNNIGELCCYLGLHDLSQQYTEKGLRLAVEVGSVPRQAMLLLNLSILEIDRGNNRMAELYLKRSLTLSRQMGNGREEGTALHYLACLAESAGDYETAETLYNEALSIRLQLEVEPFAAEDRAGLAWVYCQQGALDKARLLMEEVCEYLKVNPAFVGAYKPMKVYQNLVMVASRLGSPSAADLLKEGQEIIEFRARDLIDPEMRQSYLNNVPENHWLMNTTVPA